MSDESVFPALGAIFVAIVIGASSIHLFDPILLALANVPQVKEIGNGRYASEKPCVKNKGRFKCERQKR